MKKKITLLAASVMCAVSLLVGALASGAIHEIKAEIREDFVVKIDGEVKNFKTADGDRVYPILYKGTTYLPVRAIGEMMGKTVYWYEDEKRIELKENTVTDADIIVNNTENTVLNTPEIKTEEKKNDISVSAPSELIGEEKAKAIALEKAGITSDGVIFERVELDRDDGAYHYEVEFKKGFTEYEADIGAYDGKILSWDVDR